VVELDANILVALKALKVVVSAVLMAVVNDAKLPDVQRELNEMDYATFTEAFSGAKE